jgi:MGT family glycosyltransferase
MSRFLVVALPLAGHVNPLVALAAELERRGGEVAWVVHPRAVRPLLPAGALVYPVDDEHPVYRAREEEARRTLIRGLPSVKFFFERIAAPLAGQMLPVAEAAIRDFAAAAVVVDQHAMAGAFAARRLELPWATSSPTTALFPAGGYARFRGVRVWADERLRELERQAGLPATERPDISPHLVLVHSSRAFAGEEGEVPEQFRFFGPLLGGRPPREGFTWEALRDGSRVLVTLGSLSGAHARRLHEAVASAAADLDCQVILDGPREHLSSVPPNLLVAPSAPVLDLLPHVDAVVCHGGGTVQEALAHGLPLVVCPIRDDHNVFAERVVATGSGIRLHFVRVRPADLARAVRAVLDEPAWRLGAERIRDSFRTAGGVAAAADAVEALAAVPAAGARVPTG